MILAQALDLPFTTGENGFVSLVQEQRTTDTPMINMKNMGYEGTF